MRSVKHEHRLEKLAAQHRGWLVPQAVKLCGNEADAEDVVQETLLRFVEEFSKREPLPERGVCISWLGKTLTNVFIDQCRKRKVRKLHAEVPLESVGEPAMPEPEVRLASDDFTLAEVSEAMGSLKPAMRETYELHVNGMSYQDIAHKLGLKVGTVGKRLYDIRAKLEKLLRLNRKVN